MYRIYNISRAIKYAREWLNEGAKEILLQGWTGESLVYEREFTPYFKAISECAQ